MTSTIKQVPSRRMSTQRVERLLSAAARGEQAAWEALVGEFSGMLWAITVAHRLSGADAADVIQATWLKLLENLEKLNDPARVGAWLATTARRECLRVLRTGQRSVPFGDDLPDRPSSDEDLDARMMTAERDQALWRSFSRLRDSDQALLRLLMTEPELSYDEISEALAIPVGSIGPTRGRALKRLRRQLEQDQAVALLAS